MLWLLTGKLKVELTINHNEKLAEVKTAENINKDGQQVTVEDKIFEDGTFSISAASVEKTKAMGINFIAIKITAIDSKAYNPEKPCRDNTSVLVAANKSGTGFVDIRNYEENRSGINKINEMLLYKRLGAVKQAKMLREAVSSINAYLAERLNDGKN